MGRIIIAIVAILLIVASILAIRMALKVGPLPPGVSGYPVKCTVKVIQDGKPLEGALVKLHHEGVAAYLAMEGTTDAEGNAEITTTGGGKDYEGAMPGTHKVTIRKASNVNGQYATLVDSKFSDKESTPISVTVGGFNAKIHLIDLGVGVTKVTKATEVTAPAKTSSMFKKLDDIKDVYPCQFKIVDGGKPVKDAEIELDCKSDKYMHVEFTGKTDANGIALIKIGSPFSSERHKEREGVPVGEYSITLRYKYFDSRFNALIPDTEFLEDRIKVTEKGLDTTIDVKNFKKF